MDTRCAECGFLALERRFGGDLATADQTYRNIGEPSPRGPNGIELLRTPICFVGAFDLREEIKEDLRNEGRDERDVEGLGNPTQEQSLKVITVGRSCEKFSSLRLGLSPKEHREVLDREGLLQWQTEREETDKKWRDNARRSDRKWQIGLVLMAGLFTILGTILGVLIAQD